jgi:hypothetical protein
VDWVAEILWTGWQHSHGLRGNIPLDWVAEIRGIRRWLLKSQTVTLCSEYPEQPASASQQLVFIDSKTFGALRELAKEHFKIEPTLHLIAVYSQSSINGFLFVEVNDEAIPTGNIEPFYFAPRKDFGWPLYIADVTSDEWTKIKSSVIKLPSGWPRDPILIFHRAEVLKK